MTRFICGQPYATQITYSSSWANIVICVLAANNQTSTNNYNNNNNFFRYFFSLSFFHFMNWDFSCARLCTFALVFASATMLLRSPYVSCTCTSSEPTSMCSMVLRKTITSLDASSAHSTKTNRRQNGIHGEFHICMAQYNYCIQRC